ncbi:hypothetical protein REC12_12515 [Desulfosporosinus sp. PR]|uniref:hypothetical protein n=1 Tax=Candidatus Desulfosporosinus nitrosoreducens TaxID=3401928 RepID=UPI0027F6D35B|nr:hypothetical protein [Desulfosporosinus sp. PR]MDQ7094413.1 hypothetical protein [Desulfosporosinus sp. PR]
MHKITTKWLSLVILFIIMIGGCNSQIPRSKPPNASQSTSTNNSFFDKAKIIDAMNSQIDIIIPLKAPPTLKWHTEAISFLQPNYILVSYSEGHMARIALFLVNIYDNEVKFDLVLDSPQEGKLPPIVWDWKAT